MIEQTNPENFDNGDTQVAPRGEFKPMKMNLKTMLKGMLETRDCLGLQEHKVLTLNTIYNYPIEEPKTTEMKRIKDFGMGCFREGWIHAVSIIINSLEEENGNR